MRDTERGNSGGGGVGHDPDPEVRMFTFTGDIVPAVVPSPLDRFCKLYDNKIVAICMENIAFLVIDATAGRESVAITFVGGINTNLTGPVARQFMAQAGIESRAIIAV